MPKKRLLILLLIIISLGLMTYQSNREHISPFKFLNNTINSFHELKNSIKNFVTSPFKTILLREEENKRLKTELLGLLKEQQKYLEAIQENKRLKELLLLKEKEHRYVTTARIIAKSIDPWSNAVILDKGTSEGISKDMVAITDRGLAGKISSVSYSYSYLLPLIDINFSSAARLQESRIEGIISGTGFRKCKLKYIPFEEEIKEGGVVVTSGFDLLFPPGIPIGYVSKVNKKGVGIFQDIDVIPFVNNSKTEFVVIVKRE
jgi:rod shape-determining protein MreC